MTKDQTSPEPKPTRPPTSEEAFLHETAFKDPVESINRIEETTKLMIGAVTTACGLLVAALKLAPSGADLNRAWGLLLLVWGVSLVVLVRTVMPREYQVGRNEPESWRAMFLETRNFKYRHLRAGVFLFCAGLVLAAIFFICGI